MYSSAFGGVHWDSCDCKSLNELNASSAFTDLTLVVGGLWEARVLRRLLWSLLEDALGKIQVGSHDARINEKKIIVTSYETYFAR